VKEIAAMKDLVKEWLLMVVSSVGERIDVVNDGVEGLCIYTGNAE